MPLEEDIRALTAEFRESNRLRKEDLEFRRQLYAAAVGNAPAEAPAAVTPEPEKAKKPAAAKKEPLKVVEPEPEAPQTEDPAPEVEETQVEVAPEPAADAKPVTAEDIRAFQRIHLTNVSAEVKAATQTKIREVLAEFGVKATTELSPDDMAPCLDRLKEVLGE